MKRIRVWAIAAGVATALAGADATATPALDYTLGISLQHDDNVNQSQDDPTSDNILTPNLSFTLNEQGTTLTALGAGTVEYRDYLSGSFNDQLAAVMSGTVAWHLSPERLDWMFEDYVGRQPVNVLANDNPNNQQQTNVFSTGPTLRAHFSDALRGQIDLRYTNNYAEVTRDFNGNRFSAAGRLLRLLGQDRQITGNLQVELARFHVAPDQSNYNRADVYAGYSQQGGSIDLQGNLGYTRIDFRRGSGNHGALLADATATYNPTADDALSIHVQSSLADAASELSVDPRLIGQVGYLGIGGDINGVVVSPDVYRERELRLGYGHKTVLYHFSVAPFVRRLNYLDATESNQRSTGGYADFGWSFNERLALSIFFGAENRTYTALDRRDNDRNYGANLTWRRTRHWQWALIYNRLERNSTAALQSYNDNIIGISLGYQR